MNRYYLGAFVAIAAAAMVGCNEAGPQPVQVGGTVMLDVAPLADGMVTFRSVKEGTLDSIPVKDGKFTGKALPGERRVEIGAYDTVVMGEGPMETKVQVNRVAPEFGDASKLTANVNPSGPNEFAFEAKSKPH